MTLLSIAPADMRTAFSRYVVASALGHFVWELLQLPLYTIWYEGSALQIAFALFHCTGGDVLIAAATLLLALAAFGRGWPRDLTAYRTCAIAAIALALGYTIFSEWLNVSVRGTWAYASLMPLLPPLGTGLSPVVQWLAVPGLAFWWVRPRLDVDQSPPVKPAAS